MAANRHIHPRHVLHPRLMSKFLCSGAELATGQGPGLVLPWGCGYAREIPAVPRRLRDEFDVTMMVSTTGLVPAL